MKILIYNFREKYPLEATETDRITLDLAYEQKVLREFEFYKPFRELFANGGRA